MYPHPTQTISEPDVGLAAGRLGAALQSSASTGPAAAATPAPQSRDAHLPTGAQFHQPSSPGSA